MNLTVTCLCLTRNRREWLPKAIASFLDQTYEDRKLLIVSDGEDISDLVPGDERIRLITVKDAMLIGDKRNAGVAAADTDLICHWDDDDFSAPGRLADQVGRLIDSGRAVTGYHSIKFTDGEVWYRYNGTPNWAFDTSLCYRRDFWERHEFGSINDGLEANFRAAAIREKQFTSADGSDLLYATIHAGNTGPRVIGEGWERIEPPQ